MLALCILCQAVGAQTTSQAVGNVRLVIEGERVRLRPGVSRGETFDAVRLDLLCGEMNRRLTELGFLWNNVSWDTVRGGQRLDVRFVVVTGPRARVAAWNVAGDTEVVGVVLSVLPAAGSLFGRTMLERAVRRAVAACEHAGYPFVCVKASEVKEIDGLVVPTLAVSAGDLVRVQFLESGDPGRVSRRMLETAARFRGESTFSPALVQAWRRNILNSGWIRPDSEHVVVDQERQGIRFFVRADRPNQTDLAAGYAAGERRLTGYVRLRLLNLLNTCRRLGVGWQSQAGRTSYELSYTEPWVLRSDLDVTVSARHTTADTSYSYTEVRAGGTVYRGALQIGIETGVDRVAGMDSLSRVRTTWVGTGIRVDLQDDRHDPQRGFSAALRTRAGQRVGTGEASLVSRIEADFEVVLPVGARAAGAVNASVRSAVARARLVEPELYRLGGANSLRGFREGQFAAPCLGWLNCELRYAPATGLQVYPFFDAGTYSSGTSWRLAAGYGLGVGWQMRVGRLGVDYGIAVGDSPLQGKVHLSLATGF